MGVLCGGEWNGEWNTYNGPCDEVEPTTLARGRARQYMLLDTAGFDALVRTLGAALDAVELDAWLVLQHISPGTAFGVLLDRHGEDKGLPRLSLTWDDARYRRIFGAWIGPKQGRRTIPSLLALLGALADGETYAIREYFPAKVRIEAAPLTDDDASLWAQVLEATRPPGVEYWFSYADANPGPFVLGESLLGGLAVLTAIIVIG